MCRTLKIAVVAPMPSASVRTTTALKPGSRRRLRNEYAMSRDRSSSHRHTQTARASSRESVALPSARRLAPGFVRLAAPSVPARLASSHGELPAPPQGRRPSDADE